MTEYRRIIADGDLVSQIKSSGLLASLFGNTEWSPYRNLSREVRFLEQSMHDAHAAYKAAQERFVVAQKNVQLDMDLLRLHKMDNSEVAYITPSNESILDRREGVKYSNSSGNSSGQKPKGQSGGQGNDGQQGDGKGGGNNQNQGQNNKQQNRGRRMTALDLLTKAEITIH